MNIPFFSLFFVMKSFCLPFILSFFLNLKHPKTIPCQLALINRYYLQYFFLSYFIWIFFILIYFPLLILPTRTIIHFIFLFSFSNSIPFLFSLVSQDIIKIIVNSFIKVNLNTIMTLSLMKTIFEKSIIDLLQFRI